MSFVGYPCPLRYDDTVPCFNDYRYGEEIPELIKKSIIYHCPVLPGIIRRAFFAHRIPVRNLLSVHCLLQVEIDEFIGDDITFPTGLGNSPGLRAEFLPKGIVIEHHADFIRDFHRIERINQ